LVGEKKLLSTGPRNLGKPKEIRRKKWGGPLGREYEPVSRRHRGGTHRGVKGRATSRLQGRERKRKTKTRVHEKKGVPGTNLIRETFMGGKSRRPSS